MTMPSNDQIEALLRGGPASDRHPWAARDDDAVDAYYRRLCPRIERETGALSRIEWDHYGSGYASFVDAWFYRDEPGFRLPPFKRFSMRKEARYTGLAVLLCRLAPVYVFLEGEKSWHGRGGSGYLPSGGGVDGLKTEAVQALAAQVQAVLRAEGLTRLSRAELDVPLPSGAQVPTMLENGACTRFDALFHWQD
ncbi:hypothetical protein [Bordetella genomosp. 13]|uniref:hypothetical protein n=1 Tax=Bordetella genomosp. 13 TaxID=463040 RepID=UPI00119E2B7E|nr:hypothetical protein [Bordetella genomosp. 13]